MLHAYQRYMERQGDIYSGIYGTSDLISELEISEIN